MSQNTISGLVADHMEAAREKADRRMEAAEAAQARAGVRIEEANGFVRPTKEELRQVRAEARALGKQMADELKARGAALKAGR
ncbi:hypothetical protein APR11_004054 [Nocardia amikacinitolerans]|uniref:hypothetical protein n=1 Tax=Nocardia amikacinitolerans TaxID=756689 RepID=UPI0020A5A3E6|nr:hypothetical protein [Nocardia amikacinitolerans]MCP2297619.1 hypothetical protein [Nocardia amikacinitolerans]